MPRSDGRAADELRPWIITPDFLRHPAGSVLIACGNTREIAAATCENKVPQWMKNQKLPGGWLTCEYGMLPSATGERTKREASAGKQGGRTMEIQRLIGRSMRAVAELNSLGEHTIHLDCDVIDADGGTRCAGITGAATALALAITSPYGQQNFLPFALRDMAAAVSVGIIDGEPRLDLCYEEDSRAEVDMNVVMTRSGNLIEVQGTAERNPFSRKQLNELLDLAESGLKRMFALQQEILDGAKTATLAK